MAIFNSVLIKGGSPAPEPTGDYRVRFYDYDGSYKDVGVNHGEDAIPPEMPDYSQEGYLRPALTLQGWNRPYTNVTKDDVIGAIYIPTDGKTHLYMQLTPLSGKDFVMQINKTGAGILSIEWGDDTENFATTDTGYMQITHTFSNFEIKHLKIHSEGSFLIDNSYAAFFPFRACMLAAYIGNNINISANTGSFNSWVNLQHITIPNESNNIGNFFLDNCHNLRAVIVPDGKTNVPAQFIRYCYSIKSCIIPESVITMGTNSIRQCYCLTSLTMPSNLTAIDLWTFEKAYSLTVITIPEAVTSIGNNAFNDCPSLRKYIIKGDIVKTLGGTAAFLGINSACLFFVKDELVDSYKTATNWVTYADRIMPMSEEGNYYG